MFSLSSIHRSHGHKYLIKRSTSILVCDVAMKTPTVEVGLNESVAPD